MATITAIIKGPAKIITTPPGTQFIAVQTRQCPQGAVDDRVTLGDVWGSPIYPAYEGGPEIVDVSPDALEIGDGY